MRSWKSVHAFGYQTIMCKSGHAFNICALKKAVRGECDDMEIVMEGSPVGHQSNGQIENAIRAGKADDIRDAQEGRAKELFENRMTEWTQSQEDRDSQEIGANAF